MSSQNKERHDPYVALRNRNFQLLLVGRFITSFGNEMLSFAIGWELWLRTHQAFVLGIVGLMQVIPVILLSLPAGHVADQYNRKRIVLITELFLALCVLGLGWLSYTDGPLYLIYSLLLGIGIARGFLDLTASNRPPRAFFECRHLEQFHLAVRFDYRTRTGRTPDRLLPLCDLYLHLRRAGRCCLLHFPGADQRQTAGAGRKIRHLEFPGRRLPVHAEHKSDPGCHHVGYVRSAVRRRGGSAPHLRHGHSPGRCTGIG